MTLPGPHSTVGVWGSRYDDGDTNHHPDQGVDSGRVGIISTGVDGVDRHGFGRDLNSTTVGGTGLGTGTLFGV